MIEEVEPYFDLNDFATVGTYTEHQQSGSADIPVLFDFESVIDTMGNVTYQNFDPIALCKTADVLNATVNVSTLEVNDVVYTVRAVQPDAHGFTRLLLSLDGA